MIRPTAPEDAGPVAQLRNVLARRLYGRAETTEDDVRRWWQDPKTESWVSVGDDGWVTASAALSEFATGTRFFLHFTGGGGGEEELLATAVARARELARPEALLRGTVSSLDEPSQRLFAGAGFRLVRHWFNMAVDLEQEPGLPTWPEGIAPREFVTGRDDRAVFDADMESFEDHWDFFPLEYWRWRRWTVELSNFDPTLWVLAEADGEIAGFSLCEVSKGEPHVGRVESLGVRRPWRRRGLGLALLLRSFALFRERGLREARLSVDSENPTGAVGLYERAGMSVDRRYDTYEKAL